MTDKYLIFTPYENEFGDRGWNIRTSTLHRSDVYGTTHTYVPWRNWIDSTTPVEQRKRRILSLLSKMEDDLRERQG